MSLHRVRVFRDSQGTGGQRPLPPGSTSSPASAIAQKKMEFNPSSVSTQLKLTGQAALRLPSLGSLHL